MSDIVNENYLVSYAEANILIENILCAIVTNVVIEKENTLIVCKAEISHAINNIKSFVGKKHEEITISSIEDQRAILRNGVITNLENNQITIEAESIST